MDRAFKETQGRATSKPFDCRSCDAMLVDQMKIDWFFVRDILVNRNDAPITANTAELSIRLGLRAIGESVGTEGQ